MDKMREAFEAWYTNAFDAIDGCIALHVNEDGEYDEGHTFDMFEAWQAARAECAADITVKDAEIVRLRGNLAELIDLSKRAYEERTDRDWQSMHLTLSEAFETADAIERALKGKP
jgi:hypothetical protein